MDDAHMNRTLKPVVFVVLLPLILSTATAQPTSSVPGGAASAADAAHENAEADPPIGSAQTPLPASQTQAEDAGDPIELDPPPPPMALPDPTLRREILVRGDDGNPRVIAWLNGKIRVRDQHFGRNGERIADIEYRPEHGEVAYWMLYHHNLGVKATYTAVNGRKEGDETRYDADGHKSAIVRYRGGCAKVCRRSSRPTAPNARN